MNVSGLSEQEVIINRLKFGVNSFAESKPTTITALVFEGIKEPMMLLLLGIAALSLLFGKIGEALTMVFVVMAYIFVELINKFRTDRAMMRLKALAQPTTRVLREGGVREIATHDVVVGDILILGEGALVPADAQLLTAHGLMVNQAALTGESLPVKKKVGVKSDQHAPLAQRIDAVFSGTTVLHGEGTALVFAVGEKTEFGAIAHQVRIAHKEKTVLQESMTHLAKVLAIFAVVVSAVIPVLGFFRGLNVQEMVLTWLSLTFLMVPGQPPIIITMALALAAFALAKKNIIVKRLRGVEILGQVTSLVSDKTGTITENSMVVEKFFLADGSEVKQLPKQVQELIRLALPDYESDPTDKAVLQTVASVPKKMLAVGFSGFSDKKPWRDICYKRGAMVVHALAGSADVFIASSNLTAEQKKKFEACAHQEAALGKRVVAYAWCENQAEPGIMERPAPRIKDFLGRSLIMRIIKNSIPLAVAILLVYGWAYRMYDITTAQTAAFVAWLVGHILLALQLKQEEMSLFARGFFSNYVGVFWLLAMLLFSFTITSVPLLYPYLKTTWLSVSLWLEIGGALCLIMVWMEMKRSLLFLRRE